MLAPIPHPLCTQGRLSIASVAPVLDELRRAMEEEAEGLEEDAALARVELEEEAAATARYWQLVQAASSTGAAEGSAGDAEAGVAGASVGELQALRRRLQGAVLEAEAAAGAEAGEHNDDDDDVGDDHDDGDDGDDDDTGPWHPHDGSDDDRPRRRRQQPPPASAGATPPTPTRHHSALLRRLPQRRVPVAAPAPAPAPAPAAQVRSVLGIGDEFDDLLG